MLYHRKIRCLQNYWKHREKGLSAGPRGKLVEHCGPGPPGKLLLLCLGRYRIRSCHWSCWLQEHPVVVTVQRLGNHLALQHSSPHPQNGWILMCYCRKPHFSTAVLARRAKKWSPFHFCLPNLVHLISRLLVCRTCHTIRSGRMQDEVISLNN